MLLWQPGVYDTESIFILEPTLLWQPIIVYDN